MKKITKTKSRIKLGEKDFRVLSHPDTLQKQIDRLKIKRDVFKNKLDNIKTRIQELENLAD